MQLILKGFCNIIKDKYKFNGGLFVTRFNCFSFRDYMVLLDFWKSSNSDNCIVNFHILRHLYYKIKVFLKQLLNI